ncbi:MAG: hypothetical protein ACP5MD_15620 [Verrucomicrobiia bacterium]
MVENRWRGDSYDSGLPYSGLAVWHAIEDPAVYGSLPVPPSVDAAQWNSSLWQGWSRRGIRMIRPIYGPPYNTALWDGSSPATGYDLLLTDPNPSHVTLKWADGTPSGFSLQCIPTPGPDLIVGVTRSYDTNVLVGPSLTVRRVGSSVQLAWPAAYVCFGLQVAGRITPPDWSIWSVTPQIVGDEKVVAIQPTAQPQFYRLYKP